MDMDTAHFEKRPVKKHQTSTSMEPTRKEGVEEGKETPSVTW